MLLMTNHISGSRFGLRSAKLSEMSVFGPGLYVHVPFCAHKCEYCAFYSHAPGGDQIDRYVGAVIRELEMIADGRSPATVFFGGGTPSLLNMRQWEQILSAMARLSLSGAPEWTVECNPATVSLDKAKLLRTHGVNRISMGVQSLNEHLLERLGRIHSREMVFRSFDILREAGFDNINLDLMFAIPGQTLEIWQATLAETIAMGSEHLSSYEVIYEEDTPLYAQLQAGEFDVDEALACAMYDELIDRSGAAGFEQYEIANFARNGRRCQHNVNYWRGAAYHGLGPSAAGYMDGIRTKNWSNTIMYCEQLEAGRRPTESREQLSALARAGETAAFGLRMNEGWSLREFQNLTGFELQHEWKTELKSLSARGWAELTPERFHLTREGLRFADAAASDFLR
jgi:oxygen-independent coproporphyrinogen-3 oxidase